IDSVEFATHYEWILEDADWTMDTTGTHCTLWVTTPGTATLKVRAWNGCGYTEQELIINAGFFDVDDHQALPIAVYPNPAHDKVFIEAEDIICVRLFDLQGQCLTNKTTEPCRRVELSLHDYAPSLYLIEIQTQREVFKTRLNLN
ncbi:MAG: T9SS type A sorting domain-containing protein, partial [Bacteroidales bacterium]|nr:T9SS type A sorting domain-containing protein [Bacteroidales bacterium]